MFRIFPKEVGVIVAPRLKGLALLIVPNESLGRHVPAGKVCPGREETVKGAVGGGAGGGLTVAEAGVQVKFGWPKFGWLKMLKNSVRNSIFKRSVSRVVFNTEKSTLSKPGPKTSGKLHHRIADQIGTHGVGHVGEASVTAA